MNNQELLHAMQSNTADLEFANELRSAIQAEMEKPADEQNYDFIEDAAQTISRITGTDQLIEQRTEDGIRKLNIKIRSYKRKNRIKKISVIAICASLVLAVCNIFSYHVYGTNAFFAVYRMLDGGVTVDLTKPDEPTDADGNPYEHEMKELCTQYQIDAFIPTYIPAGFKPTENYGKYEEVGEQKLLSFYFKRNESKLTLRILDYESADSVTPIGIPTDTYNISERTINGTLVSILKEGQEFRAVFLIDTIQYLLSADKLDYDECQLVLDSMLMHQS
ncbi:MAG: DUF4367 domain-containing protein [Oscillospiraceae bacterium]|nr:DUF4367 domain-containing protein [Oscillospiraceae bacterium]